MIVFLEVAIIQILRHVMREISNSESFLDFYEDNSIYVDKTEEIYSLIKYKRAFFSRPRRFGKSTVLDTIAILFEYGVDPYFKGTWIYDKWNEKKYPVLRLNLLEFDVNSVSSFVRNFNKRIEDFAKDIALDNYQTQDSISESLSLLFRSLVNQKIVILIDEYDSQLTANINNTDLYNQYQNILRSIYAVLKGKRNIRFLGITGVTRLKDASIFSMGSDIKDVTYQHNISTITGFTREEIKKYYIDYINLSAAILNNTTSELVTEEEREEILNRLAYEYNGYCFDKYGEKTVFSTWSVNNFFVEIVQDHRINYGEYWYENGGLPAILRSYLENHEINIDKLKEEIEISYDEFTNPTSLLTIDPNVLMCQVGYLTLNSPLKSGTTLKLKIPNYEVRKALYRLLSFKTFGMVSQINFENQQLLEKGTADDIFRIMNAFVNSISYDKYPITNESVLRGFLHSFLIGAGLLITVESQNSKGRSDIQIDYDKRRIILELKYANHVREVQNKLDQAVNQIKNRDYGNTLPLKKELLRIALVFNAETREFSSYKVV